MTSLICGSLAYDTIMSFEGKFSEALLADQLHNINVCFLVPAVRREFGGCAGNIAYNLHLLGGQPLIMATIGQDGGPYLDRLKKLGITDRCVRTIADAFTAQGFITTDASGNQITAFHPGAMSVSHENVIDANEKARFAIIAPDGRNGMLQHSERCVELGIPFIFDPGQQMPMFNGEELRHFISLASYVAVNDYEAELLMQRTGWTLDQIANQARALFVTRGEMGSDIYADGKKIEIPAVPASRVQDPTGCGDAFRAGILYGLENDLDWPTTGRLASLMGSIKIAHQGAQNHYLTRDDIEQRFEQAFGYRFA